MLERINLANGAIGWRYDGRYLCSSIDPVKEAQSWVVGLGDLSPYPTLVLLGVGAGYHVAALTDAYPKALVVAIEADSELRLAVGGSPTWPTGLPLESPDGVLNNPSPRVKAALRRPYCLLIVAASYRLHSQVYEEIRDLLTSREEGPVLACYRLFRDRPVVPAESGQSFKVGESTERKGYRTVKWLQEDWCRVGLDRDDQTAIAVLAEIVR